MNRITRTKKELKSEIVACQRLLRWGAHDAEVRGKLIKHYRVALAELEHVRGTVA